MSIKVTKTRNEVLEFFNILESLKNRTFPTKFIYNLIKIKKILSNECELIKETIKPNPKVLEYEKKRKNILISLCEKDEFGKPKLINGGVAIPKEKQIECNFAISELDSAYQDVLNEFKFKKKEYESFLNEEVDLEFDCQITEDMFPSEIEMNVIELLHNWGLIK